MNTLPRLLFAWHRSLDGARAPSAGARWGRSVRRVLLSGLSIAVLLLGLLGADSPGTAGRDGRPDWLSASVLGDPSTVDPCSVFDAAALREFGRVRRAGTVSLNYCLLHVRTDGGQLLQLAGGELHRVDAGRFVAEHPSRARAGLRIVRDPPVTGHCARQIVFSDGIAMRVNVDLLSGDPPVKLCSIAGAGARAAADAISAGEVEHRSFPKGSLTTLDPCTLLGRETIVEIPGLEHARPKGEPTGHKCQWGGGSIRRPSVELIHTAGRPPKRLDATSVEERIAGRRTVLDIIGDDPSTGLCSAETGHIPFGDPGAGQVEVAMLVVFLPGSDGIRACEFARGLAERAWPRLPEP